MPYTGDQLYGKEFEPHIELLAQQKTSLLRSRVAFKRVAHAEEAYFHQIQALDAPTANADRHGDTPSREAVLLRRRVTPLPFEDGYLIDKPDVDRMVVSPQNVIVQSLGSSFGRWIDDLLITAAFANAATGKAGGTAVTFQAESISLNGTTGGIKTTLGTLAVVSTPVTMELAKILAMAEIYDDANVPESDRKYWAITPKDKRSMMAITTITSSDFTKGGRLDSGVIGNFNGFDFIVTTRLPKDAATSTAYRTLCWSEGGLGLAFIQDLSISVDRRADKKNATGVYATIDGGAVRVEGSKVHECLTVV
ncbi:MAG TPA: phage capsid protein [Phycisphaerae bacterium]|nr:phage capsid protein [Phycisphaerae bacterium]